MSEEGPSDQERVELVERMFSALGHGFDKSVPGMLEKYVGSDHAAYERQQGEWLLHPGYMYEVDQAAILIAQAMQRRGPARDNRIVEAWYIYSTATNPNLLSAPEQEGLEDIPSEDFDASDF